MKGLALALCGARVVLRWNGVGTLHLGAARLLPRRGAAWQPLGLFGARPPHRLEPGESATLLDLEGAVLTAMRGGARGGRLELFVRAGNTGAVLESPLWLHPGRVEWLLRAPDGIFPPANPPCPQDGEDETPSPFADGPRPHRLR